MGIRKGGENGRRYFEKNRRGIAYHIKRDITGDLVCIQIHTDGAQSISGAVLVRFEDIPFCTGCTDKELGNYICLLIEGSGQKDKR